MSSGAQCEGRQTASQGIVPSLASTIAKSSAKARQSRPAQPPRGGQRAQAARDLVAETEAAGADLLDLAVGDRGAEREGDAAAAVPGPGERMFGGRVLAQRGQRRRGIEVFPHQQRLVGERRQHGELLALVARAGRQRCQLRGAGRQAPQTGLHAKRCADGGVEIEAHE